MKNIQNLSEITNRETVIYFERTTSTTPWICGGLCGWGTQEDWTEIEKKADELNKMCVDGKEFIYSTVFCADSKRLYHVFGYPGPESVSLVFVYVPGFQKNITEKVKKELVQWVKETFSMVRLAWESKEK